MKKAIRGALPFALMMIPIAAVGGWFTGSYAFASYTAQTQALILEQVGSLWTLCAAAALESAVLAFVCALVGHMLSSAVGLMRSLCPQAEKVRRALPATVCCGVLLALDRWTFGRWLPQVGAIYADGLLTSRLDNWIASILYGGVVEELMLRLFLMSLLSLILWKLLFRERSRERIPPVVFSCANLISALLFAAGHLPTTVSMFGGLTPLVVLRCFLLNGVLGLVFGWLYRRLGIQYAMLGHAGAHLISKLIWLL